MRRPVSAPGAGPAPDGPRPLLILHHAGGSAGSLSAARTGACGPWPRRGRSAWPGPGAGDHPCRSVAEAVDHLVGVVTRDFEHGCALFGHSMGGLLAFETPRKLERLGRPASRVGVSGCVRPAASAMAPAAGRHRWSADRLTAYVRELGGTPKEARLHPGLRDCLLGVLRADLAMVDGHRARADARLLRSPGAIFRGLADPVADPDGWSLVLPRPVAVHAFTGGHFYLFEWLDEVAARIDAELGRLTRRGPEPSAPSRQPCTDQDMKIGQEQSQ
ncbi:thioesterase domain-containing protein [Streptomyces sp. NPDC007346]|uniref:thioesterase II family protein n=1 Tax=Streptomyces sp. NPDC007346 TaxID=3154682 RepID=UPI0034521253